MKKTLLLFASAALLLVGCQKEKLGPDAGSGEMVTANFTAQMQGMPQTKSVTDGAGAKANRCVMEIYYKGVFYTRDVQPIEGMKATFTPRLVSNRTYDVLFWADCGEGLADKYYTTDAEGLGLQAVEMKATAYAANDDARDAFYTTESVPVGQQVSSETFTLTRPFAQVNIITTDAAVIKNANLYPDGVKMVYTAPTMFNLLTETLSEEKELTVTGAPYEAFDATSPALTLEMDYLFTGEDKSALDIAFEASKTGESTVTSHSFTNIPVQRNYRTNIKGALLTTTGDWTATIVPGWNQPDEEVKYVEAGSVAAANEAFANGATSVKITSVGEETNLYLPQTTEEVTIDFANPDKGVTVKYRPAPVALTKAAVAGDKPAAVNIATNDVTKFTVSGISNIVWLAGNQTALASALNNAVAGHTVALSDDITMTENWVSVYRGANTPDFDGRNHVISNMTIKTQEESYAGLFSTIENHVILQNVTFRNALIDIPASVGDNARGGILVGHMYPSDVVNCHVEGATIKAHQKMGGLIGYVEGDAANKTISIKDCSVKDITLSSNVQGSKTVAGVGGLIGHLVLSQADLITVENNSVENIIITDSKPIIGVYNYDDYGQYLPHVFIGNACQNYKGEEAVSESKHSIVLENNRILGTNTELSTCIYSSEYFGWGGNAEDNPSWKGKIYIDGQEWTPNYPFKNVTTGKGYATLDAALTALKASETLEIWEAGEYTVETLKSPANSTIDAKVEGVVFNHTAAGSSWIASDAVSGRTVKNITWNIGNANYQALHVANLVGCTINGRFYPHGGPTTFTDCVFNAPGYDYCLWTWNNDATFKSCTFNTQGKAVNVYGAEDHTYVFEDCVFNATNIPVESGKNKGKAAIFVKDGVDNDNKNAKVNVSIKNCTANYERPYNQLDPDDVPYSESVLWNVEIGQYSSTNEMSITLDGEKVYPFTKFKVNDVAGLRNAIKMFNKGKEQVEYSIELADGTYEVSDMVIAQNVSGKSLTIKAATAKGVTLKIPATPLYPYMFMVNGCSSYDETRAITFNGFKFDVSAITDKSVAPVMNMSSKEDYSNLGYPKASTGHANDYGGYITIDNCELIGGNGSRNDNAAMYLANSGASPKNITVQNSTLAYAGYLLATYVDGFTAKNVVTTTPIKHFINNQTGGVTVDGCTVECNTDYAVRSSAGPVSITNSAFTMTYTGTETGGIYVDRGANTQVTMSGNTYPASYAGANMHDVYNEKGGVCTISNGSETIATLNNGESYDFPRQ